MVGSQSSLMLNYCFFYTLSLIFVGKSSLFQKNDILFNKLNLFGYEIWTLFATHDRYSTYVDEQLYGETKKRFGGSIDKGSFL